MQTVDFPDVSEIEGLFETADRLVVASSFSNVPPRVSPVFYAAHEDSGTIYWLSHPNARHSKNVEKNGYAQILFQKGSLYSGLSGQPYPVTNGEERARAYALLKEKAKTLPETLDDLDQPNSLRDIYAFSVGEPFEDWNEGQYVALGTLDTDRVEKEDDLSMSSVSFQIDSNKIIAGLFPSRFSDNLFACLYDSTAQQGTGIGLYFHVAMTNNFSDQIGMHPNGELWVNGAVMETEKPGWIDQRRQVIESVLN